MISSAARWIYALAPDVRLECSETGTLLRSATDVTRLALDDGEIAMLRCLATGGGTDAVLRSAYHSTRPGGDAENACAALLYRLERAGLLARGIACDGHPLAWCVPSRAPAGPAPEQPPRGELRLSPFVVARTDGGTLSLETPGGWARVALQDRDLFPLLHDLSAGRTADELARAVPGRAEAAIHAVLALLRWCGLLVPDAGEVAPWSGHDLLLHTSTRRGYRRVRLGKLATEPQEGPSPSVSESKRAYRERIALTAPDLDQILTRDPPYGWVSSQRRSTREYGETPVSLHQISEFLFRTLHCRDGRRPFPSAGGRYPLRAHLVVDRCAGLEEGLYEYKSTLHALNRIAASERGLKRLLADAAGTANTPRRPQILLVLTADYPRIHRVYGDLSYSLILKEVGAVFQVAMMAAAAMGLGVCPLGCGDSLLFAELVGADPRIETSVGELALGTVENGE